MKKLSLGKLNLLSEEVLQRSQLASIYGGSGGGSCCVHYRDSDTDAYLGSTCGQSYSDSVGWYHMAQGSQHNGPTYVSGYCCTSCN
ncbi:hypothetical protein [Algoriphagus antarcticus]|uniref:Natural product n=1 Tax=Algoriphagus antarcticus TaxID=238540 RepID=A0A3E0DQN0_9BACT|nr:hypothetical protein [Algoriphagus antarcticus]REG84542.1 hypothetical protein C8N25_115122 [Algoriphagus antarcticus]